MNIVQEGRRLYVEGDTYAIKDCLRGIGAKWDATRRAWWVGSSKREALSALLSEIKKAETERAEALPPASGDMVVVSGNTYPVRTQLQELGGAWDRDAKVWRVPESRLHLAEGLVQNAPKTVFRHSSCRSCGARPNARGYPKIYRNGICSDCYTDGDY